ncbi:transport-associated protein [Burkholderia sp. lig30]|jgi:osmotically-inducible protein OsmY|uniref:BON domain-containing protein n=1 Tax=Burkholderia sp. lig30 TaxID=1192124 RepID=UPI0004616E9F|nr:BON domain-containing protein [Burkholderia sp. lig30]KDB10486.1 transport-associated protein [Burkholderia sp. lig30]
MKSFKMLLIGAVVAAATASAHAQTTVDAASGTAASAPTAATKKVIRRENRQLSNAVHRALTSTKGLTHTHIVAFAKAQSGDVVLAGFIDDPKQEQIAIDAARKVPGVASVESKLTLIEGGR